MTSSLLTCLERFAGQRVLCVGDVMLDKFIYGEVSRISPEAPVPVLRIVRESNVIGGAGNVVRNIIDLGGMVDFIAVVGEDNAGYEVARHLSVSKHVSSYLLTNPGRPTTIKTRFVAGTQQLLRADYETSSGITEDIEEQVISRIKLAAVDCRIIVLSDYAKGALTERVVKEAIQFARQKNLPILVDPKVSDYSRYSGATLVKPNRKELAEASGRTIENVEDAEAAARELIQTYNLNGIMATLGADGICLVIKGKPAYHFEPKAREVYDVSGAGDTVIAALALGIAGGASFNEAAEIANYAGSIVVGKIGTATTTVDDLSQEIMRSHSENSAQNVLQLQQAKDLVERWRAKGQKIGFTNGCFDLIHPGHISLLRQARAACDKLIVGLNTDASVQRLKGPTRPVQNELSRATVLSAFSDVDAVVLFDEDTPIDLIKALRPDVLIKGADYTVETVVGSDLVQGWGGKVVLADLVAGQSTTSTITRMQDPRKTSKN